VTVKFWRGSQAHILQRVTSETRGGRFEFDVLENQRPADRSARPGKAPAEMNSPYVEQELLPEVMPSHGEWAPDRLNLLVYALQHPLGEAGGRPEVLAGPARTEMEKAASAWNRRTWMVRRAGRITRRESGLELFRRMADNGLAVRTGHITAPSLVAAGEIPLMLGSTATTPSA